MLENTLVESMGGRTGESSVQGRREAATTPWRRTETTLHRYDLTVRDNYSEGG